MKISDIAAMAGVSSAAVSRYFNNGYLSEAKKEAIRKVVEETGYHPSIQAQMLRTKKTKTIGVIIPRIDSTVISQMVSGVLAVLNESGYRMLLADTHSNPKKEQEYMGVFDETQVDGIIISGTVFSANYRKAINKLNIPVVIVGQSLAGFNCIYHDDYHAMHDMTQAMIDKGRTRLGYIGALEKDRAVGENRYRGYCDALKENGLPECRDNYVISDFSLKDAYQKMGELMGRNSELDAVVCATDQMAVGALWWLRENRNDRLDQIALSGQGDSDIAAICSQPISTIRYFYEESGAIAARRVLELILAEENDYKAVTEVKLGYEIIDRIP